MDKSEYPYFTRLFTVKNIHLGYWKKCGKNLATFFLKSFPSFSIDKCVEKLFISLLATYPLISLIISFTSSS